MKIDENGIPSYDLRNIYIDVLKKGFKVKAFWAGDMICISTYKPLTGGVFGDMELHGHTVYIKGVEELTEEKYGRGI